MLADTVENPENWATAKIILESPHTDFEGCGAGDSVSCLLERPVVLQVHRNCADGINSILASSAFDRSEGDVAAIEG